MIIYCFNIQITKNMELMIFHVCNARNKDTTIIFMTIIWNRMMSVSLSIILIPKQINHLNMDCTNLVLELDI